MGDDETPDWPDGDELLELVLAARRRGLRQGMERAQAEDLAHDALVKLAPKLPHPNPPALYNRIWQQLALDLWKTSVRRVEIDRQQQKLFRPEDSHVEDRLVGEELRVVRDVALAAGLAPGSVLWRAACYRALGLTSEDMAARHPGTTTVAWRKAWSRAARMLRRHLDDDDEDVA